MFSIPTFKFENQHSGIVAGIDDYLEDERERKNGGAKRSGLNIIAEKEISIETLTVREAIMKMDLTDRPVLIFKMKIKNQQPCSKPQSC